MLDYRADIDGLRAIAVLAVVLYHYGIGGLQGGFVGVDVFFVISGYLITGIIHKEMQRGDFTLTGFYERRARRIFPALFVMLLVTMVAGLFLLLPSDLVRLGKAAAATVLFVSNVQYLRESGYFDSSSDFNPLLHTWSLGVEEQFYVGLPLLLMLAHRYRPAWMLRIVALCALSSFAACVVVQPIMAKPVFFLSPFRAWELLLGSLLALGAVPQIRGDRLRGATAVLALLVLIGSVAFMRAGVDFPGWKAAMPVLATAALLHVGAGGASPVTRLLTWRPLVFVGLISYSLYLWHWPILVLVNYQAGMQPLDTWQTVVLLAAAALLAVASYRWVEQPLRRWRSTSEVPMRARVFAVSGACALLLLASGASLVASQGLPQRVPSKVLALDRARLPVIPYQRECDGKPVSLERAECRIGAKGNDGLALVWGDSWAIAWAPALDQVLKQEGRPGILALLSACAPLPGVNNRKSPACLERNTQVLDWIREHRPERVYLVAAWRAWVETEGGYPLEDMAIPGPSRNDRIFAIAYPRTLQAIRPYVKEIVVIGPTPGAPDFLPYRLALSRWHGGLPPPPVTRAAHDKDARQFWQVAAAHADGIRIIDPAPWFCDRIECRYQDARELLYRDGHHLSVPGARFVARQWLAMVSPAGSGVAGAAH